jgi:twitching motility protein PilT
MIPLTISPGNDTAMDTLLIDKLLQSICSQEASELHLAVGSQPVIHLNGQVHPLATKILDSGDTVALMKSITPERCQQELRDVGRTEFGFAFAERARFRVVVSKERGNIGLVVHHIPTEVPTHTLGGATTE